MGLLVLVAGGGTMGYAYDLFISYAHIDDRPVTVGRKGWVTQFHDSLAIFLSQLKGSEARIWRDSKLRGNDLLTDEILDQFAQTAVLVSVLTPSFVNSDWCAKEIVEFCRSADGKGGVVVGNQARIFKVEKTPVKNQQSLPAWMRDVTGYQFYVEYQGRNLELEPSYGEKYAEDFLIRVRLLAEDIVTLLEALANEAGNATDPKQTSTASIYLAECSGYQWHHRKLLERELLRQGYSVLPDRPLPRNEEQYASEVRRMLEHCTLAIHLVDEYRDPVLIGPTQKSAVMFQNALAAERSKAARLPRVIWLPKDTRSGDDQQQAFIDALDSDAGAQFGADLIRGSIEELKASIRDTLKRLSEAGSQRTEGPRALGAARLLHVICDERDVKATVPIRKFLRKLGCDVETPVFEGNATRVREENQLLLERCDAVVLFYGAGGELWKRTMDGALKKLQARRKRHAAVPVLVYLADPWTSAKQDLLDMESPDVIDGREEFPESALDGFLRSVVPDGAAL